MWYGNINNKLHRINSNYLNILANILYDIIMNDYDKIKRLSSYLKNVETLFNKLNLPIICTLPTGLKVKQSYMERYSVKFSPFNPKSVTLNLKNTDKNKYKKSKQLIYRLYNTKIK